MKQVYVATLLGLLFISLNSCHKVIGKGPVVSESRSTKEFSAVSYEVPGELRFIPSEHYEISIEAQRNILDVIDTYVSGQELKIKVKDNTNIRSAEEITITVKGPSVHSLSIKGSGNLNVLNTFSGGVLNLDINGSGRILVNKVEADELHVGINGSGHIEAAEGTVDHEDISISGSGHIDLLDVEAKTARTHTSGSGSIKVYVIEELDTKISGSGDVFYKGNPSLKVHVSGSGKVLQL